MIKRSAVPILAEQRSRLQLTVQVVLNNDIIVERRTAVRAEAQVTGRRANTAATSIDHQVPRAAVVKRILATRARHVTQPDANQNSVALRPRSLNRRVEPAAHRIVARHRSVRPADIRLSEILRAPVTDHAFAVPKDRSRVRRVPRTANLGIDRSSTHPVGRLARIRPALQRHAQIVPARVTGYRTNPVIVVIAARSRRTFDIRRPVARRRINQLDRHHARRRRRLNVRRPVRRKRPAAPILGKQRSALRRDRQATNAKQRHKYDCHSILTYHVHVFLSNVVSFNFLR